MAFIFAMDEYELTPTVFGVGDLNYRLLDEQASPPSSNFDLRKPDSKTELTSDDSDSDTVADLLPIPVPSRARRRSSVSKYSSSYEIDINESFVSSSLQEAGLLGYKPKLDDFEPLKVLGQGSYGKVILVREKLTGKLFAQKQLKKASLIINETNEVHTKNYERTLNEKTILEKVSHPNIVKLFYAFQDHNKVYLILEYLDGGELFHHLDQQKYMSEKDASYYIAQIILALRYLHLNMKVIYRDLKPENCMLNADGNLVLTDFGLSKVSSDDSSKHSMIGTAQYMAPEVIKGEQYDFSVDWWSLGCVAYDMLTGAPPFTGHTNEKIMDKVIHSKKYLKFPFYLSLDAKDLLRKLLQANPAKRIDIDKDFEKLKSHRFFRYVDWDSITGLSKSDGLPPILPVITDSVLAENFDEEFTSMKFTPPIDSVLNHSFNDTTVDILHVKGFTFTNESYLVNTFKDKQRMQG